MLKRKTEHSDVRRVISEVRRGSAGRIADVMRRAGCLARKARVVGQVSRNSEQSNALEDESQRKRGHRKVSRQAEE
jgi:hypothetical protein